MRELASDSSSSKRFFVATSWPSTQLRQRAPLHRLLARASQQEKPFPWHAMSFGDFFISTMPQSKLWNHSVANSQTFNPPAGVALDVAAPMEAAATLLHPGLLENAVAPATAQVLTAAGVLDGRSMVAITAFCASNSNVWFRAAEVWRRLIKLQVIYRRRTGTWSLLSTIRSDAVSVTKTKCLLLWMGNSQTFQG